MCEETWKKFKKIFNITSTAILGILFIAYIILFFTHKIVLTGLVPYTICWSVAMYVINVGLDYNVEIKE